MSQIIEINGRKWLAGMAWRSFEAPPSRREVLVEGVELDASWAVVRRGSEAIQAGFSEVPDGTSSPRGVYSMAATVAELNQEPWLGIYELSGGLWWFVAVRDGHAILPRGDVVGSRDDIEAARKEYAGFQDWTYVEGTESDLAGLLDGAKRRKLSAVQSLHGAPPWAVPAAAGLVGLVVVGGGLAWWQHVVAERARADQLAREAANRARRAAHQARPAQTVKLAPDEWLAACERAVGPLPAAVGGWRLGTYECQGSVAQIIWHRGPGATPAAAPPGELEGNGNLIRQTITLAQSPARDQQVIALQQAEGALYSLLLPLGAGVTITSPAAAPLPGATPQPSSPAVPFQAQLSIAPFSVRWGSVPGLVLESATATEHGGWTVSGNLYGR